MSAKGIATRTGKVVLEAQWQVVDDDLTMAKMKQLVAQLVTDANAAR